MTWETGSVAEEAQERRRGTHAARERGRAESAAAPRVLRHDGLRISLPMEGSTRSSQSVPRLLKMVLSAPGPACSARAG